MAVFKLISWQGTSLSTFTNWASNLIFAQCSPIALSRMGYQYFYIFMVFNWIAAAVVYFCYPETQGHTLESVNALFDDVRLHSDSYPNEVGMETAYPAKRSNNGGLALTAQADDSRKADI